VDYTYSSWYRVDYTYSSSTSSLVKSSELEEVADGMDNGIVDSILSNTVFLDFLFLLAAAETGLGGGRGSSVSSSFSSSSSSSS
jgi:hypothetical protein